MSAHETDERALFVRGQAGYLAFIVTLYVLVIELGASEWAPYLLTWKGWPIAYLAPGVAGTCVFYGYSILHKTADRPMVKGVAIAVVVSVVLGAVLALAHHHLF